VLLGEKNKHFVLWVSEKQKQNEQKTDNAAR
jgi:hypothetical protein